MSGNESSFLRVSGTELVDDAGTPVRLHGIGLGGLLTMENWITGFPGHEDGQFTAVRNVLGPELGDFFFDRFIEHFFTEADAAYLAALGLNMVRIPFHYRFLEHDDAPFEIREEGFEYLDRLVRMCARHGIRTILDLHVVPGWQNQDWHCDNPTHTAQFWRHRHFQDRVLNLWKAIAAHYKGDPWVVGYNPINEPGDPTGDLVGPYCVRLVEAIREIDQDHIIFLDGNRFAIDFHVFRDPHPLPNTVYSPHFYPPPTFTPDTTYPGNIRLIQVWAPEEGKEGEAPSPSPDIVFWDQAEVERGFLERTEYARKTGTPLVIGEFNAVFPGDQETDRMRLNLLTDIVENFHKYHASWTYWSYKDVGLAAPLTVAPDSPWVTRIRPVLEKKARLAVDHWGGRRENIAHVLDPVREVFAKDFPNYRPFPWGSEFMIDRLIPHILFASAMLPEFGELFRGMTEEGIDQMMRSFRLENCQPRQDLVDLLSAAATRTDGHDTRV